MSENRRIAQIERVYAGLPKIQCQKLCAEACGPVFMSRLEWKRVCSAGGDKQGGADLTCPYLIDSQCSVYDVRPGICRLFGLVEKMRCPHGCIPERWMTDAEAYKALEDLARLEK